MGSKNCLCRSASDRIRFSEGQDQRERKDQVGGGIDDQVFGHRELQKFTRRRFPFRAHKPLYRITVELTEMGAVVERGLRIELTADNKMRKNHPADPKRGEGDMIPLL